MSQDKRSTEVKDGRSEEATGFRCNGPSINTPQTNTEATMVVQASKQQAIAQFNEFLKSIGPYVSNLAGAAAKVIGNKASEIAGAIWDEFKGFSRLGKLLAILGTALLVGAIGYASWKLVAGNWDIIKSFTETTLASLQHVSVAVATKIGNSPVVHKMKEMFEQGVEELKCNQDNAKLIFIIFCSNGLQGLSKGFLESVMNKFKQQQPPQAIKA